MSNDFPLPDDPTPGSESDLYEELFQILQNTIGMIHDDLELAAYLLDSVKSLPPLPSPAIPPSEPDKPQPSSSAYESALASAIHDIKHDYVSGARQLADKALQHLLHIVEISAYIATHPDELRDNVIHAAKQLCNARSSMSAAIKSCILRTLELISKCWNEGQTTVQHYGRVVIDILREVITQRKSVQQRLNHYFVSFLQNYQSIRPAITNPPSNPRTIRMLTLSNSSTIRSAILHALSTLQYLHIHLHILESRPRCEAINLASQLLSSVPGTARLTFEIFPDSAVGLATQNINIVLLGADRILANGDVSNKIGSLSAALCAKWHSIGTTEESGTTAKIGVKEELGMKCEAGTRVVVLSDSDKIAGPQHEHRELEPEVHPSAELSEAWDQDVWDDLHDREEVRVNGEWFEWVNATLIDVYVTEIGILGPEAVEKVSTEVGDLEKYIFGSLRDQPLGRS